MFEKIKQLYIVAKIKIVFIRDLSPTRKQILVAHAAFLDEVEKQFPYPEQLPHRNWTGYALAALAGIFILNGGAVIYADTTDVPLNHPLYAYKRIAEEVRVKTATSEKQPEIEVKIAQRRIKELKYITLNTPKEKESAVNTFIGTSTATSTQKSFNKKADTRRQKQLKENFKLHIESVKKNIEKKDSSKISSKKSNNRTLVCKELTAIHDQVSELFDDESDARNIKEKITKVCSEGKNRD